MAVFERRLVLPVSCAAAFEWHARPGAFERLTPLWESVQVLDQKGAFENRRVTLRVAAGPFRRLWVAQHKDVVRNHQFVDAQVEGPFRRWVHTHSFQSTSGGCALT